MHILCNWCQPNSDSCPDPARLCPTHAAEYYGCTVAEIEAADAAGEWRAELERVL